MSERIQSQKITYYTISFIWHSLKEGPSQVALLVKNSPANAGDVRDVGLISGLGRSPGGGYGSPLQYSYLENPMDRGAWWTTVHRVTESWTVLKQLSIHACTLKEETVVTENRSVVAGGLEAGAGRATKRFLWKSFLGWWNCSISWYWWWLHESIYVLKFIEMYVLPPNQFLFMLI